MFSAGTATVAGQLLSTFQARGHEVSIIDNYVRRQWDYELGVQTLTPIRPLTERLTGLATAYRPHHSALQRRCNRL